MPPQQGSQLTSSAQQGQNFTTMWDDAEYISEKAKSMYEEIVFWRKNLFKLPSGAAGKKYIKEQTRLLQHVERRCATNEPVCAEVVHGYASNAS